MSWRIDFARLRFSGSAFPAIQKFATVPALLSGGKNRFRAIGTALLWLRFAGGKGLGLNVAAMGAHVQIGIKNFFPHFLQVSPAANAKARPIGPRKNPIAYHRHPLSPLPVPMMPAAIPQTIQISISSSISFPDMRAARSYRHRPTRSTVSAHEQGPLDATHCDALR